jgi:hypothetical protein
MRRIASIANYLRRLQFIQANSLKMMALVVVLGLLACKQADKPNVDLRPLESVFTRLDEVKLQGLKRSNAMAFTIDPAGAICVIDKAYKHVKKFDGTGRLIQTIGAPGTGPGQFVIPWGLSCDASGNLYVLDVAQSRVSIFDKTGNFQRSFIFSSAGFSGTSITVSGSGDVYLGGWKTPLAASSTMIHRFDQQGNHLASFFPVDEQVLRLNLAVVAGVDFAVDADNNLYSIQRVNPQFFKYTPAGELAGQYGRKPPFYQDPVKFPRLEIPRDESRIKPELARWTQLNGILALPHRMVLLVFQIHKPQEYAIEIYDETGRVVEGSIGSDLVPVFQDRQNRLYFVAPSSEDEPSDHLSLLRCSADSLWKETP